MITTREYWDIDGTPLNTLAYNIETLGGRKGVPTLRGSDIKVPYRAGQLWRPKQPDSRTIHLGMWVIGADENGNVPSGVDQQNIKFNDNWDKLQRLYFVTSRQVVITKRWELSSGLVTASALGAPAGDMEASMLSRRGAKFIMDFLLSDPFFYGVPLTTNIILTGTHPMANPGQDTATKMKIRFNGPLTNPRLTNVTANPDIMVQYTGVIAGGAYVDIDTDLFTAKNNLGASVISGISHDGARHWMELLTGTNSMALTASAGTGTADITLQAPYL